MRISRALALSACLIAGLSCASTAQVPTRISDFPSGTADGTEYVLVSQGGISIKLTTAQIAALGGGGSGAVSSVFGRTGAITAQNSDYTFSQIAAKPTTCAGYGIIDCGNAIGASSSVDGHVALFVGTDGKHFQDPGYFPNLTIAGNTINLGGNITASTILDSLGAVQGDVAYRGPSGWNVLAPGTSGQLLASQGTSANLHWVDPTSGGTLTSLTGGGGILLSTDPCIATCTISTTLTTNAQTGTTYAAAPSDGGKVVTLVNASAIAVSIVQANTTNFTAGYGTTFFNKSATIGGGVVTVTAAGGSLFGNGLATLKVYPGQAADIASDSTNYSFTAVSMPLLANNGICANISGATNYCAPLTSTNVTNLLSANPLANTNQTQVFSGQQTNAVTTLSIATATFTPDGTNNNYKLTLIHASCPCTLANPSATPVAGTSGVLVIVQSATGSDLITTWGSQYVYQGGTSTIALSTAANAVDVLSYYVIDSTHILLTPGALNATH